MYRLINREKNEQIGQIRNEDATILTARLMEESTGDDGFYIWSGTLEWLKKPAMHIKDHRQQALMAQYELTADTDELLERPTEKPEARVLVERAHDAYIAVDTLKWLLKLKLEAEVEQWVESFNKGEALPETKSLFSTPGLSEETAKLIEKEIAEGEEGGADFYWETI